MEGEDGAAFASESRVAIVADALRDSATICAFFEAGAGEIWIFADPEVCREMKSEAENGVTAGERDGKPLAGFDFGNSPCAVKSARLNGETVLMATDSGAPRIVEAHGASAILVGGPRNFSAVAQAASEEARRHGSDIVVVAAGLSTDEERMSIEDLAAACLIAGKLKALGASLDPAGTVNVPESALPELFRNCPNGRKLKTLGYAADVAYCAEIDRTKIVPYVADWRDLPNGDVAAVLRRRSVNRPR
jgi:2-phosphosulfolactate phosphatase